MKPLERIEWCNIWVTDANADDRLPRLLLVGDSITQSYFDGVEKALAGQFRCARLTTSRCAGDPQLKKELALLLDEFTFAAIHLNNGLHGWGYDEPAYAKGLADLLDFIKARSPKSRLLWGSTTPVWKSGPVRSLDAGETARVRERNRIAKTLAAKRRIPLNDLFKRVIGHPELVSEDGVHFNADGQAALARQVARFILKAAPPPAETVDLWHGFKRHRFTVAGRACWLVEPKRALPGKPWTWCMMFPDAFTERTGVPMLLKKGYHHLFMDVGNTFGCPSAMRQMDAFYDAFTARGLARKGVLIGISRGGLYTFNWAARNPDKVCGIYADAGVFDFKSWPAGKLKAPGSVGDWKSLLECYGFANEAQALAYRKNPVDNLAPLARAGIALLLVVGDADEVVPVEENSARVETGYRRLGGRVTVIHKPGVGHHPHGLDEPAPIVKFIRAATTERLHSQRRANSASGHIRR